MRDKDILSNAIETSDIVPEKQKKILKIVCLSPYPISARFIEQSLEFSKQSVNFSIRSLLTRNFILKEKDGVFMYKPNKVRVKELIVRYKNRNGRDKFVSKK